MNTTRQRNSGTYRCPVCGHRDTAELGPAGEPARIECSYCGSGLRISASDPGSHGFTAQVAEVPAHG
ncbi:MAG: hypothetical protein L0271_13715 [Gemmatimonadetes bacterium]|nr:hypothetical protein [Gemmatimonadota bacterium]